MRKEQCEVTEAMSVFAKNYSEEEDIKWVNILKGVCRELKPRCYIDEGDLYR